MCKERAVNLLSGFVGVASAGEQATFQKVLHLRQCVIATSCKIQDLTLDPSVADNGGAACV